MKKIIITIVLLGIIGAAWYLLSPLFINTTINEAPPITSSYSADQIREIVLADTQEDEPVLDNEEVDITTTIPTKKPILDTTYFRETEDMPQEEMEDVVMDEPMPEESETSVDILGSFESKNNYSGSGQVKIITDGNSKILRFENFSVTNGPDLFVTLNKGDDPKGEHIILQKLKGNKGNQNYDISNYDIDDFNSISIYCRAFSREFATAQF